MHFQRKVNVIVSTTADNILENNEEDQPQKSADVGNGN